ncbi:MAG TPA: PQQ-binding-like beta-propeller repeat protein [Tepidisphaeraceae bacterium]|jgi:outer membrane protein assembly factor BamB|nr:PQQ-binding-like beta-propeller repeat protein [Tepidisphaeraceae bacterium]
MGSKTLPVRVVGVFAVVVAGSVALADWPQWRGSNRDAKVTDFTAPATWPKELTQKWKVTVGDGVATPALVGDKLYVFSRQDSNEIVRCLTAADGKEVWADKYPAEGASGMSGSFPGPRCSPAVADGKVVTIGVRGMISCLDAATGKKIWRKDEFQGSMPQFFTSSSPLITDGLVIAQLGGRDDGAVVAYDLATGEQKWKSGGASPAYSSPVLMTISGTKLVIAMTDRKIIAVNVADGKQVWETPFAAQRMAYNAASPVVDGQTLIYSGGGRGTTAVKIDKDGDKFTGKELWSNGDKSVQFSTPVVRNGLVYGLSQSNELFCIDEKTGKAAWNAAIATAGAGGPPPGGPAGGPGGPGGGPPGPGGPGGGRRGGGRGMGGGRGGFGSIIDAGPVLMALTPSSELIVFDPDDQHFVERAKIKVADSPTHAYPVVSGDRVFIKDKDSLTLWTVQGAAAAVEPKQ